MMNGGWIKLHRGISDHWIWRNSHYVSGWIGILTLVNWQPTKVCIRNEIYHLEAGESCRSIETWARDLPGKWTRQSVRTFFNLLENDSMIVRKSTNRTTILTVCNYETYQNAQPADNQQLTSRQPAANQQLTTDKEYIGLAPYMEEGEEGKNLRGPKRKRFVPPSAKDVKSYCDERQNAIDPEAFISYYEANGWKVGRNKMKDWMAAVRTWERRDGGRRRHVDSEEYDPTQDFREPTEAELRWLEDGGEMAGAVVE